ncbi:MAG TPA: HAMP domain-containing sensor histidine kinase [Prolixibacteraceae bacterium]|nr:HAMP domain-containing sensor histidine kinase [Prolixibacteraceae bacterium]HOR99929.1 HAMP domain-containing sensor histidine kinase [Prolixibacteraceae bacterium]HPL45109.1 HAMP domain-containing sensor histidine kinase [Prolixibacteraceae bacterium]
MSRNALKYFIVLSILSVAGIFLIQFAFLKNSIEITENEFQESANIALREVAWQILEASGQTSKFDNIDPVEKVNNHLFLVNVNDAIDPEILKTQLSEQFKRHLIKLDFEYAIFDPSKNEMVYGEYVCAHGDSCEYTPFTGFPLSTKYSQYFGVNFPNTSPYINLRLQGWYFITGLLFIVLLFFGYALWVIIRQRQLTDIQKIFINNLTHELKTPISSISLSAQVLSDEKIIQNPARLFEYVRIINEQSNRLAMNVEKVLNLTALEKNKLHLVNESIDLHPFTEKTIARFQQSKLGMQAQITMVNHARDSRIWADPFHLDNILQNILENAIKYCRNSPVIEITLLEKRKHIHLKIKDNGIGIPLDARKKIFRKFYRVPTGNIHDVKGFGLGLDYVHRIVKAHRWKIKVEGNDLGGSTFTLIIPKRR